MGGDRSNKLFVLRPLEVLAAGGDSGPGAGCARARCCRLNPRIPQGSAQLSESILFQSQDSR